MKKLESQMCSAMRSVSRLGAAVLTVSAFAFLPPTVHAQDPAPQSRPSVYSARYEQQVEQTCEEWEKVRRCANAAGELQLECAAKSPLAKFWAMLRGERERDDEVEVVVIRRAPADSAAAAAAAEEQVESRQERDAAVAERLEEARQKRGAGVTEGRHTTRVVKTGELPRCQENG